MGYEGSEKVVPEFGTTFLHGDLVFRGQKKLNRIYTAISVNFTGESEAGDTL